jgi:putative spermidine/putrescine transport system substrate-binding protein
MTIDPLRILVTQPSAHREFLARAREDVGIDAVMHAASSEELLQRALDAPDSFDLVQLEYWMLPLAWRAGILQRLVRTEVDGDILPLFTAGTVAGRPVSRVGQAPHAVQFVDEATGALTARPTSFLSLAPTICNSDTLGWRPDLSAVAVDSWAVLLDDRVRGQVALSAIPAVGIVEAALACQAANLVQYRDIGDMSRREIDDTIDVLAQARGRGQFHGFWHSFHESVRWMQQGDVVVQSLWPPAVTALRSQGMALRYDVLSEGGRGWAGGFGLAAHLAGGRRGEAMRYLNWYLSGWAGAFLTRQGYYPSMPARTRPHLSASEWNYWQEGLPAHEPVLSPQGTPIAAAGERREGGSFARRMGSIACWSAALRERAYLGERWASLIAA